MTYWLLTEDHEQINEITAAQARDLLNSGMAAIWHHETGETYLIVAANNNDKA